MNLKKSGILAALLSVFLLLGSAVPMHADDRDRKCEKRIHNAEAALHKAVRRHGEHSRQAQQKRHELEETRERCGHRDHDHDHDHDHH